MLWILYFLVFLLCGFLLCRLLYRIIKAAVRDGIREARESDGEGTGSLPCPFCGRGRGTDGP